ncbi:acetoacetyl-CoA synthase [Syncephalis plumigaleata]|nr:acetoacetyl-CoA synthase [Syncephalis plumigaleata]
MTLSPISTEPKCLWRPKDPDNTEMSRFRRYVNERYHLQLDDYNALYAWSCRAIGDFWSAVWDYTGVVASQPYTRVINESTSMDEIPVWFEGARLNYAENLLRRGDDKHVAIVATGEGQTTRQSITYADLRERVRHMATALRRSGVTIGDRVAGYIPNCVEAIVVMLAATSIGAIYSATSPDFGTVGVLDRFNQIRPKILFSVNAIVYNGKTHDHLSKLKAVVEGLDGLEKVVIIPFVADYPVDTATIPKSVMLNEFIQPDDTEPLVFEQLPFNHPVYILYSSGTTGLPKCLVHSAGGMLLQHQKEHIIHNSTTSDDVFFQYTTTGWMMWNWLVAGLATGCTIPDVLWSLTEELGVSLFGTSAKYIQALQDAKFSPGRKYRLERLRAIFSTGSPLSPESYEFVYKEIKSDLCLGSITGGTDICSTFATSCNALPVYRGEIQCRALGMSIEAWVDQDKPVFGQSGDLVCTRPFPCMPVKFWNDDNNKKYRAAYFDVYPGVWYHGDFIWISPVTGGVVMLGRSDGTLNPAGVRFGSAELYNIVETYPEIEDSLAVGQKMGDDERVYEHGYTMTEELVNRLRANIREKLSPRHVPAIILPVTDIPVSCEIAVKRIISNIPYSPSGTLANPECLDLYRNLPELKLPEELVSNARANWPTA